MQEALIGKRAGMTGTLFSLRAFAPGVRDSRDPRLGFLRLKRPGTRLFQKQLCSCLSPLLPLARRAGRRKPLARAHGARSGFDLMRPSPPPAPLARQFRSSPMDANEESFAMAQWG